jgi:hypothetical protein
MKKDLTANKKTSYGMRGRRSEASACPSAMWRTSPKAGVWGNAPRQIDIFAFESSPACAGVYGRRTLVMTLSETAVLSSGEK